MHKSDIVILSVPYTDPLPMVAPVLLSACLNQDGIKAKALDFSVEFYKIFSKKPYWNLLKNMLVLGNETAKNKKIFRRIMIDILKFNKNFLLDIKKNHDPSWLGLSIFTSESIPYSYILVYSIRKYLPHVKIVIGGKGSEVTCSFRKQPHYKIYVENGLADLAIVGDCEHEISSIIANNTQGIYFSTQQTKEDLDRIPVPNWDEYDLQQYKEFSHGIVDEPYMAISASKGCVRNCTFCDVADFWPKYIYRDPTSVADEIIAAYKKTGIKKFMFTDNLINGSVSHYRTINKILAEKIPNQISYIGYAIFRDKDYMPAEDFELAQRAGCTNWWIGVESGSERLRFELGKKITDEDLDWSANQLALRGIEQTWLMMVGYPTETEEDFQLTLELFKKYAHLGKKGLIKPSITPTFTLLKNSPLIKNIKLRDDLGLSHNVNYEWADKFWTSTKNPDNIFPVRARRWKTAIQLVKDLGYPLSSLMGVDGNNKWTAEIDSLERLYHEQNNKIIPIHKI